MKIPLHTVREYADAIKALLPPGAVWEWPVGGFGDSMLLATGQELVRIEQAAQDVLDQAIVIHTPKATNWNIAAYRAVAKAAVAGVTEAMHRTPCSIGSRIGSRLWSITSPDHPFPIDLVRVDHLFGNPRIGSRMGVSLWKEIGWYVLRVRYYRSVVDPAILWAALSDFKQAHVFLWFEDITGAGGHYAAN